MKVVRPAIALNGIPYLQMRSIGSHIKSESERKGKKEMTWVILKSRTVCLKTFPLTVQADDKNAESIIGAIETISLVFAYSDVDGN